MKILITGLFTVITVSLFAQSAKLFGLKTTMYNLHHYHKKLPSDELMINNVYRDIRLIFDTTLVRKLGNMDTALNQLSYYLPYFDSTLKANNINMSADVYLCDLLVSSLDSSGKDYVFQYYEGDSLSRRYLFNMSRTDNKELFIANPERNYCREQLPYTIGDKIISMNGVPGKFITNSVFNFMFFRNDSINLTLLSKDNTEKKISLSTVLNYTVNNKASYELTTDSIATIDLIQCSFFESEVDYLQENLKRDKYKIKKLIIDARDFTGGRLVDLVNFLGFFFTKPTVLLEIKCSVPEWDKEYSALKKPLIDKIPITVLTNKNTCSGANIVVGVLKHYKRATIIGQVTSPIGYVHTTNKVIGSETFFIKYYAADYYLPDQPHPITSIIPDILFDDCDYTSTDKMMEYAIKN